MIGAIGRWFRQKMRGFLYVAGFFFQIIKNSIFFLHRKQVGYRVLTMQILYSGVESFSVVAFISAALGAVIIIQGVSLLPQFGQGDLIYVILIAVITRELGPILTAFILIARSGTAIATELGNMVVSHEIEAYMSVGINPVSYLVVPRFLGVTISMIVLNVYFNLFGIVGSFAVTQIITPLSFQVYFENVLAHIRTVDILSSTVKSVVFGIIISAVATYNGFRVQQSATEIPVVAIKSVSQGFVYCIIANALITMIYYI
jgi:phospholipid/cholesterol/gamma-HCH transport system permease protein